MSEDVIRTPVSRGWVYRSLDVVKRLGNKLPDPAILFLLLIGFWILGIPLGLGASYRYPLT
jgi:p-aminobenzoyl-glutamate transporter AbgT